MVFSFSCALVLTCGLQNPVPVLRASDGVVGDLGGAERFLIIPSIFFCSENKPYVLQQAWDTVKKTALIQIFHFSVHRTPKEADNKILLLETITFKAPSRLNLKKVIVSRG